MDGDLRRFLLLLVVVFGVIAGLIVWLSYYAGREAERLHLMNDGSTAYSNVDRVSVLFLVDLVAGENRGPLRHG